MVTRDDDISVGAAASVAGRLVLVAAAIYALALFALPFLFQFQRWDGVIYEYAIRSGDFSGVHRMHWDVGSLTQFALFHLHEWVAPFLGLATLKLFALLCTAVCIWGVYAVILALAPEGADRRAAVLAAVIMPLGALVTSTMLATAFLLFGLGLLGAVRFARDGVGNKLAGMVLIVLGMQMFHAAGALLALAMLVHVRRNWTVLGGRKGASRLVAELGAMAVVGVAAFFLARALLPSSGIYAGYDVVQFPTWQRIVKSSVVNVISIGLPLGCVLVAALPLLFWSGLRPVQTWSVPRRQLAFALAGLSVVVVANAVPFVLTGRSASSLIILDRYRANLDIFRYLNMGMLTAQIGFGLLLADALGRGSERRGAGFMILVPMVLATALSAYFWTTLLRLDHGRAGVVAEWSAIAAEGRWKSGTACQLPPDDIGLQQRYSYGGYELNFLSYLATGRADTFLCARNCTAEEQAEVAAVLCSSDPMKRTYVLSDADCDAIKSGIAALQPEQPLPYCHD